MFPGGFSMKKINPMVTGIIAVASPLPLFVLTCLWGAVFLAICFAYSDAPDWAIYVCTMPLWISPALCVAGIIHGIVKRRAKRAWIGILLSALGLLENFLLILSAAYLGSRF